MLSLKSVDGYLTFDAEQCAEEGTRLAARYQRAQPFPHIVLDEFLPRGVLQNVLAAFPSNAAKDCFDREQERLKFQFQPEETNSGMIRNLFAELNSRAFLGFLEKMTGISGLIADPEFTGGGLHETKRGGHLGVHADFNVHEKLHVERRLNLLIYLNHDWREEYGGQLELWDRQMKSCEIRVRPEFGRAVIFNTALDSFHGHPEALTCPADRTRRSLATYYYTAPEDGVASLPVRTTNFRSRPGTGDKRDWKVRRIHLIRDWVPPKLQRFAHRLAGW